MVILKQGFRQSQTWLHKWSGLLLGWLLYAVFLTGTVSYFQDEITFWMHPERHQADTRKIDLDAALASLQPLSQGAALLRLDLPTQRNPLLSASWSKEAGHRGVRQQAILDPASGRIIRDRPSEGGNFFYRFHFQLWHINLLMGRYLIGVATMFMLVAMVSGVIVHKKIFRDFFTFRPGKGQRSWLDGHLLGAVLALPFHLMITFSGLVIFAFLYMPWPIKAEYGDRTMRFFAEANPMPRIAEAAKEPMPLPALSPFLEKARQQWGGGTTAWVTLHHPGDRNAQIEVGMNDGRVTAVAPRLIYSAADGQLQQRLGKLKPVAQVARTLVGLHLGRYAGPLLRWLYFLSGLGGTFMVASGLLLWAVKRNGNAPSAQGWRLVRVLNVATLAGLPIAMTGYLYANRLLPDGLAARDHWEIHCFFGLWFLALLHAEVRPHGRAWVEQLFCGAGLLAAIPLLDWLAGHWHWPVDTSYREWLLPGFDLTCLTLGTGLGWLGWKVLRHPEGAGTDPARSPAAGDQELASPEATL